MNPEAEKLRAIFSTSGWTRFIDTLRVCRDAGRPLPAALTLASPTDEERRRHAALLRSSNPSRAQRLRYDLGAISHALAAAALPADWETILAAVCGPIPAKALAASASRQAWNDFWPATLAAFDVAPFPLYREWLDALRRDGLLKRSFGNDTALATRHLETAANLLRLLPLADEKPLAEAAAIYCEGSHALDPNQTLSTLILRNLALRRQKPLPSRASDRRALWGDYGIVCDELSAPVLTFNLGLTGNAPLAALVTQATLAVQPIHLTTRLLWATPWAGLACPARVFVCENPTIIALAATRLGSRCPPLVCVDGELKTAARHLLRALRAGGSMLYYHGDFDWPGLGIADRIFREFAARPWRFDAIAYHDACSRHSGRPLTVTGTPIATPWSPQLSSAMQGADKAYDEELLAELLLRDLDENWRSMQDCDRKALDL
ncbi:MAG: TIGR02679 family protein [Opitutaceae bacterium]|jgi:uncharacterized protein (TIGR02679 family)|nr:TIGR02679 family protein [Opitutaceae bacterium]